MNKPSKDPLDQLFETLAEARFETPPASFLQDVEARLDAQQKKRRKPLAIWWVWSAFGAVVVIGSIFFWQGASVEPVSSGKQQVAPIKKRVLVANNTTKLPSTPNKFEISAPLLSLPQTNASQHSSGLSTQEPFISNTYSISASDVHFSAPNVQLSSQEIPKIANQEVKETKTVSIDSNGLAKMNLEPTSIIPSHKQQSVTHAIGLQFGISGIFSSYAVPEVNPLIPGYSAKQFREARAMGERQTSSWDFNLRYQLGIGAWQLQTGIHYLEWGEQLQYDVISVEGTNRYKYVQVPVMLGHQFNFGKIGLTPYLGAAYAHALSTNGTYIQPLNNGVSLVSAKTNNWNALAQLELSYQIQPELVFTFTPCVRQTIGLLIDNGLIMNRYTSIGVLSGFIYRF